MNVSELLESLKAGILTYGSSITTITGNLRIFGDYSDGEGDYGHWSFQHGVLKDLAGESEIRIEFTKRPPLPEGEYHNITLESIVSWKHGVVGVKLIENEYEGNKNPELRVTPAGKIRGIEFESDMPRENTDKKPQDAPTSHPIPMSDKSCRIDWLACLKAAASVFQIGRGDNTEFDVIAAKITSLTDRLYLHAVPQREQGAKPEPEPDPDLSVEIQQRQNDVREIYMKLAEDNKTKAKNAFVKAVHELFAVSINSVSAIKNLEHLDKLIEYAKLQMEPPPSEQESDEDVPF